MKIIWGMVIFFAVTLIEAIPKIFNHKEQDFGYAIGSLLTSIGYILVFIIYSLCKYGVIM